MQVIDGTGLVVGRASSQIAKMLLKGEEIHLINAEQMVIAGNPIFIVDRYKIRRRLQNKGTPEFSPVWPKLPHMLVRRIIRGMLPWKKASGRLAYKKLRVYVKNPKNLQDAKTVDIAKFNKASRCITMGELCKHLGFRG